jgi:hypothetical protein
MEEFPSQTCGAKPKNLGGAADQESKPVFPQCRKSNALLLRLAPCASSLFNQRA